MKETKQSSDNYCFDKVYRMSALSCYFKQAVPHVSRQQCWGTAPTLGAENILQQHLDTLQVSSRGRRTNKSVQHFETRDTHNQKHSTSLFS